MYWTTLGFVAFSTIGCRSRTDHVTLAVASSAEAAATEAFATFGDGTGRFRRFTASSSPNLVRQVEQGIGYHVVLLAHPRWADALGDRVIDRTDLLANEVVLVAEHTGPTLDDLAGADCVAMGDPEHVPAGIYARSALEREGLWPLVEAKVRPTLDAPAAVWAVRNGVCAVGAVYRTDAVGIGEVQVGAVLQPAEPVRYPLVLLDEDGRALFEHLQGPAAWPAFEKRGFIRP